MEKRTLFDQIVEAIDEARILECAMDRYDTNHMLTIAQRLSGAPFSFVEEVFTKKYQNNLV